MGIRRKGTWFSTFPGHVNGYQTLCNNIQKDRESKKYFRDARKKNTTNSKSTEKYITYF